MRLENPTIVIVKKFLKNSVHSGIAHKDENFGYTSAHFFNSSVCNTTIVGNSP